MFRTRTRRDGEYFRQEHEMSSSQPTRIRFDRVATAMLVVLILVGIAGKVIWG